MPLGDFLTAEEPVWVWDAEGRRILWANQAGRAFWGEPSLDALRARRFSAQNKAVARMASLARAGGKTREWTETLILAVASGRQPVKCTMQVLQVAGGRPGLIVRAVDQAGARERAAPHPERAAKTKAATASDHAALKAIAAKMKTAVRPERGAASPGREPAARAGTAPAARNRKGDTAKAAAAGASLAVPQAEDAAGQLPDALVLLLRELCHELRNPLTVILGFSERIRDGGVRNPDKVRSYAGNILQSAELAMDILADFSNRVLHPGARLPEPDPAEVGPVVAACLQLIAPLAAQAGLKVSRSVAKSLPRLTLAERVLKQILLNVLMNAVRHQKTGGMVRVAARKRHDGAVRITVSDDGIGMTKKDIKAVMSGAPGPLVPRPGRSGLGLPLVKRLVEAAGGTLAIESARYKGTAVEIVFPASAAANGAR